MTTYANVGHILLKRGNTVQSASYTGPLGELTYDTGLNTVRMHDNTTAGGRLLATQGQIDTLTNSIGTIANIDVNFVANINTLLANAATQSLAIGNLTTNVTALTANAATQSVDIGNLIVALGKANVNWQLALNAANVAINSNISLLTANAATQQITINNLVANIGGISNYGNANVAAYLVEHPQSGTYSNANVSAYLPHYGGGLDSSVVYHLGGVIVENADLTHGATSAVIIPSNGASDALQVNNYYGPVNITSGPDAGNLSIWSFGTDGSLVLPASMGQIGLAGYTNGIDLYNGSGSSGYVKMNYNDQSYVWVDTLGGHIQSNGKGWLFDNTGNIVLPQTDMMASPQPVSYPGIVFTDGTVQTTAYVSGTSSNYGNANVAAYLLGNVNIGSTLNNVHLIKGNVVLGPNVTAASGDSILTVNGATSAPKYDPNIVHIQGRDGNALGIALDSNSDTPGQSTIIRARRARNTSGAPSAVQANDRLLHIGARGYGSTGYLSSSLYASTVGIDFHAAENHTDSAQGTFLELYTTPLGSTTGVPGLVLLSNSTTVANTIVMSGGIFWSNGVAYSSGGASTYGNTQVAAYLYYNDLVSNANINVGQTTSVHHISGNLVIGPYDIDHAAGDSALTINLASEVPYVSNAALHISGANNKSTSTSLDSIGTAVASTYILRRARGTTNALSPITINDPIGGFMGRGYGATGYYAGGNLATTTGMTIFASENYTDSAQGTYLSFRTTPNNNVLASESLRVDNYNVTVTGNLVATNFAFANGVNILSTVTGTYSNANVASYLPVYNGNISVGNVSMATNASIISFPGVGASIYTDSTSRIGSIVLQPASTGTFPGVLIGGSGRILAPNGSVHMILNAGDVTTQVAQKLTSGTTSTSTTSGALQVSGGAGITGNVYIGGQLSATTTQEAIVNSGSTSGNVSMNYATASVFYVSPTGNIGANVSNFTLSSNTVTSITIWMNQGATPYYVSNLWLNNASQTIKWQAGVVPTPNANKQDVYSFSVVNISGTYTVLGQQITFG